MRNLHAYRLMDAIGMLRDDLIAEALPPARKSHRRWVYLASCIAAAAAAAVGIAGWGHTFAPPDAGTSSSETSAALTGVYDGEAFSPVSSFVSPIDYSGPILPLTLTADEPALTAERELTLSIGDDEAGSRPDFTVVDQYTLTNDSPTTAEALTVTAVYPIIARYTDSASVLPVIRVNGEVVPCSVYAGDALVFFTGGSADDADTTLNINLYDSVDQYEAALSDGNHMRTALTAPLQTEAAGYGEAALREAIRQSHASYLKYSGNAYPDDPRGCLFEALPEELFLHSLCRNLQLYGSDGEAPILRWSEAHGGSLSGSIDDIRQMAYVFYLSFSVTVPAGGSAVISASMEKPCSADYRDLSVIRIDAVSSLGSCLRFTAQTVRLGSLGDFALVSDSFGFTPENSRVPFPADGWGYADLKQ